MDGKSSSQVSSPNSTGGGGTHFEQHAGAAFLAWLLVRAIPPILIDCTLSEVHFQTERFGWNTDDILLVGENGAGTKRKLVCQVKQTLTVSSSDPDFAKSITDAWRDFTNRELFDRGADRFALVTLRGTDSLLRHFAGLLDCARASRSAEEFNARVGTKGLVHGKIRSYLGEVTTIVQSIEPKTGEQIAIWEFLRLLHILSFDLNTPTRQSEAQIKSLLAYTAGNAAPVAAADATWNELLREVGEGKPEARSYRREDLATDLCTRHSQIATKEQNLLTRLREHSKPILDGIRTTIGSRIEFAREGVIQSILDRTQDSAIILISGSAGAGKSGLAKRVIEFASQEFFTFAFRAEEFAVPHLDQTLNVAQLGLNGVTLGALLSGQSKKLLLIESVERLLEATTRDAFADLLSLVAADSSWKVILTCRDYSTDLVRTSLLQLAPVSHMLVAVPTLDDQELDAVAAACPEIAQPLANKRLRRLLSNPYMLDKATQMPWPSDRPLPENEVAFRDKFWAEVVRASSYTADGMPRRRQEAFVEIALRRARSLTLFASRDGLDAVAVNKLTQDSLVTASERTDLLVAPAHDVLEDWAILQWIDEQHALCGDDLTTLSERLGAYPAIRRGYRKWLGELVERSPKASDALFTSALTQSSLAAHFRDDTLVSLLNSSSPQEFVHRHVHLLFGEGKRLLKRLIHLLRVGCVAIPPWFEGGRGTDLEMRVPAGEAWPCILELVKTRLTEFQDDEMVLLLGLINDAARGISWRTPYPLGSEAVTAIAHWLLTHFTGYRDKEEREQILTIIAKLPKCDEAKFRALCGQVDGMMSNDPGRVEEEFRKLLFSGMEGDAACRDFPDIVVAAARAHMLMTEEMLRHSRRFHFSQELEAGFGILPSLHFDSFPASAYHGPFYFLLRHHLSDGISFLLSIFNHSSIWYSDRRVPMQYVEQPFKLTLIFADGMKREQWGNPRLWNWYRGTSVGPSTLQSALMALERRLLEVAIVDPDRLDGILIEMLRGAESASITGVAASIAIAHPRQCTETLLVMLSCSDCILLDRARMASEIQRPSLLSEMMPVRSELKIFDRERKEADSLPHRSLDLENAIMNLQLGAQAGRVHELIDKHIESIAPTDQRSVEDRMWLLALRRMDLREYQVTEEVVEEPVADEECEDEDWDDEECEDEEPKRLFRLDLQVEDADLLAMSDEANVQQADMNQRLGLLMWGIKTFQRDLSNGYDPEQWRQRLDEARRTTQERQQEDLGASGPAFVAAVCIRDHLDELADDELAWCAESICGEIEGSANHWNEIDRIQRQGMEGDRPCASVVSLLIGKSMSDPLKVRVRNALVLALTHANREVRTYATDGAGRYLWGIDRNLALQCVAALVQEAELTQAQWDVEMSRPFGERIELHQIEFNVASQIRTSFYDRADLEAYDRLDISDWIGSEANCRILSVLRGAAADNQLVRKAFQRLAVVLATWWDECDEDDDWRQESRNRDSHSDHAQIALTIALEEFVVRVDLQSAKMILDPILEATDRHPSEIASIIEGLVAVGDRSSSTNAFWDVWQLFADRIKTASWFVDIEDEHADGREPLASIFLTQYWKTGVRHWRGLDGVSLGQHAFRVHDLFEALRPTSLVLDNYVRFLYHIGETCLPSAFSRIALKLGSGDAIDMLRRGNTVFMLESLLRRYIYSRPLELKSDPTLKGAILYLLDALVDNGSSSAYRMRDDFVTPLSVKAG